MKNEKEEMTLLRTENAELRARVERMKQDLMLDDELIKGLSGRISALEVRYSAARALLADARVREIESLKNKNNR